MKIVSLLTTAALTVSINIVPDFPATPIAILSQAEAHENALKYHPEKWIVESKDLEVYLLSNRGSNHTIYLSDEEAFVSMATVEYNVKSLVDRESGGCIAPAMYTKTYTKQTGQWYGPWSPASQCVYTGLSTGGGSQSLSYSSSITITENAGLDWNIIKDVLSVSLGLSVAESWSETSTYNCAILAHSVGQIWSQPYLAWGWFWSQTCFSNPLCGGCGAEYVDGGATAPARNPNTGKFFNIGCSTDAPNVRC